MPDSLITAMAFPCTSKRGLCGGCQAFTTALATGSIRTNRLDLSLDCIGTSNAPEGGLLACARATAW